MKRVLSLLALFVFLPACAREAPLKIRCELAMPPVLAADQAATLEFALVNEGDDVVQVLGWQTPFEGFTSPMFTVLRDGQPVEYVGRMMKRGAPRRQDYLMLKPGERRARMVDLADGWDVAAPGSYTVEYSAQLFDVIRGSGDSPRLLDALQPLSPGCNTLSFTRGS